MPSGSGERPIMLQDFLQAEDTGGHGSWTDFSLLKAAARAGPRLQPHTISGFHGGAWWGVAGDGQQECPERFNSRLSASVTDGRMLRRKSGQATSRWRAAL